MIGQGEPPKGRSQPVRKLRTGGLLPRNIQILVQNTIPVSYVRCDTQDEINPVLTYMRDLEENSRDSYLSGMRRYQQETKMFLQVASSVGLSTAGV